MCGSRSSVSQKKKKKKCLRGFLHHAWREARRSGASLHMQLTMLTGLKRNLQTSAVHVLLHNHATSPHATSKWVPEARAIWPREPAWSGSTPPGKACFLVAWNIWRTQGSKTRARNIWRTRGSKTRVTPRTPRLELPVGLSTYPWENKWSPWTHGEHGGHGSGAQWSRLSHG